MRMTSDRNARGATVVRVLNLIVGSLLALVGVVLLIAAIALMLTEDDPASYAMVVVFCAMLAFGGISLIVTQSKLAKADRRIDELEGTGRKTGARPAPQPSGAPQAASRTDGRAGADHEVVSRREIAGQRSVPVPIAPVSQFPASQAAEPTASGPSAAPAAPGLIPSTPGPAPSGPHPQQPVRTAPATASPTPAKETDPDDVAGLIIRSDNLFATLKDLVRHDEIARSRGVSSPYRHLASMLDAIGLMAWEDAPTTEAGRLFRNHHYWIRLPTDQLSDDDYDRLVSVEAALSLNQDLPEARTLEAHDPATMLAAQAHLHAMPNQVIRSPDVSESLSVAYPGTDVADTPGEWYFRISMASAAEWAVTPFRVVYDLRAQVATGTVALGLEIPRPACMAILTIPDLCVAYARSYALRLSVLLARQAFFLEPRITRVVVNGHERGSDQTILSLDLTRELLRRLSPMLSDDALDRDGFPSDPAIRARFADGGWFEPIEPHLALDDPTVSPRGRFRYPELDTRPVSERLAAVTGSRTVSDLGINENAPRIAAWERYALDDWETTEEAVARLVALRDETRDITVAEACTRTANALVSGVVDASDRPAMQHVFIAGSALEAAVARAEAALSQENADPESAVSMLRDVLAPIEALGPYIDDETTVYRYFGSISERIRFNLDIDDHRREVRLVPDAYYNALANISLAYDMLGNQERAMRYADEMMRIAPASVHAALRKVRLLENGSRIFEAADLIRAMLRFASTPRDAAICHYRLAFMEWKLGREDLCIACYQRSLAWETEMSAQAREELDDLLSSNQNLHRLTDDEVASLLAREGIPLGCDAADRRRTTAAAALTCDEGIFWASRPLVGVLFAIDGDDVIMGVFRSLAP